VMPSDGHAFALYDGNDNTRYAFIIFFPLGLEVVMERAECEC